MDPYGLPEKRIVTTDGTRIAYWISRPPETGDIQIALALANGIGISRIVWQDYYAALKDRYTIVFWDYRSSYQSDTPADLTRLTLEDNARDLAQILEAEGLEAVVVIGWSMGVQVGLELWEVARERIAGMVLMNGTSGRTFDTAFGMPGLIYWVPRVTRFLSQRYVGLLNRSMAMFFRSQTALLLRAAGVVGPTIDMELLGRILDEYATHDYGVYFHQLNSLGYHRPDHLEQIDAPVLILAGSRDTFTPLIAGKRLRDSIPGAEYEVMEGGTHYMLMEFPARIRARIEQFLELRVEPRVRGRVMAAAAARAAALAAEVKAEQPDGKGGRGGRWFRRRPAKVDPAGKAVDPAGRAVDPAGRAADPAGTAAVDPVENRRGAAEDGRKTRARAHEQRSLHTLIGRMRRRPD